LKGHSDDADPDVSSGALELEPVDLTAIARSVCEELQE
jgi:hypothetical protein